MIPADVLKKIDSQLVKLGRAIEVRDRAKAKVEESNKELQAKEKAILAIEEETRELALAWRSEFPDEKKTLTLPHGSVEIKDREKHVWPGMKEDGTGSADKELILKRLEALKAGQFISEEIVKAPILTALKADVKMFAKIGGNIIKASSVNLRPQTEARIEEPISRKKK